MEKLRKIYLLSAVLIYLHGLEEIVGGFQHFDSFMKFGGSVFNTTTEMFYWISHLLWWLSVPLIYWLIFKLYKSKNMLLVFSIVYISEIHHLIKGVIRADYYPGIITALFYPVVGFFFIKEFLSIKKSEHSN